MCLVTTAAEADVMTLEEALSSAYETNPQLEAARAKLRATDEEVAKALAGWRPTISVSGSYGWQQQSQTLLGPQAIESIPESEHITVSQSLFDGRTIPGTARAKELVEAGRAELAATEGTVLYNATVSYFAVLRDTAIVSAYQEDVDRLGHLTDSIRQRLRIGDLTKTDTSQAEARLIGSRMNLASAQRQLAVDRASFEHIVGRPAETLSDHPLPKLPTESSALDIALAKNPDLLQSKAQARAADHAVDVATGALLPSLSLNASYGRSIDQIAPGVSENGVSIMGQLSIPLYQGGAEEAGVRQAKEQSAQAFLSSLEAERQVRDDVAGAWETFDASRKTAELATAQADANDTAYHGATMEAQVGSRTILDILNADQERLQSKIAAITQQQNSIVAAYQILRILGRMNAADLKLPVKLYDPKDHYDADATKWFGFGD
jgi:outer membrane protein